MVQLQEMLSAYSDETAQTLFDDSFFHDLFCSYGVSEYEFNSKEYTQSRVVAQLASISHFFKENPTLPRTVLDLGCGAVGSDGDQLSMPHRRFCDYYPWFSRALHMLTQEASLGDAFKAYTVERHVGVDIGRLRREAFENYQLDIFAQDALVQVPGKFGVIIASSFFNSPRLSRQMFGDYRNDSGVPEYTLPLIEKLTPALESKLVLGKDGTLIFNMN